MIPMDTVKTRLVVQGGVGAGGVAAYTGVRNCFMRVLREEGIGAFYRALPPRLCSVVPMIAIQFGVYEIIKARVQEYNCDNRIESTIARKQAARQARLERKLEAMEVMKAVTKTQKSHSSMY